MFERADADGSTGSNGTHPPNPIGREIHLRDYLNVVLQRRRLVIAVVLSVVSAATLRALLTPSVYEATAQLLIERDNPSVLSFQAVTQVNAIRDDYLQTQYKLLQSRSLARKVVEGLNLLNDREFGGPRDAQVQASALAQASGQSPVVEGAISALLGRLRIQPLRNSLLVNVSFEASRPELAASVVNSLVELYIQQTLDYRFQTGAEASEWLGAQVALQRKNVEKAEAELVALKEKEGMVNIDERRMLFDQRLKQFGAEYTKLKGDRLAKEALYRQMRSASAPEELPDVMRNPLVQSLRIELSNLERQQVQLLERYMDQHPEVLRIKSQIRETQTKIRSEAERVIRAAENDWKAAAAEEASVNAALEQAKSEVENLSKRAFPYDTLKREVDANKEVLNNLLTRHKQTDVAQELTSSNIRIVDRAPVPRGPVRPQRSRAVALGLVLGVGLALGLAFFLEYLDNTLRTPEDVRQHLGVPLLGVIPQVSEIGGRVLLTGPGLGPGGHFEEGYRVIRTALDYSWPDNAGSRIIMVTSTAPGEGKTLTASNVALALAGLEGKVLLVDADFRSPCVHSTFGIQRSPGLTDILVGKAKPSEAIVQVAGTRLSILTAGSATPHPADLLTGRSVPGFLEGLRGVFDWVVIDTPPVGAVVEPLILAPLVAGVVVVAGAEMVPRKVVIRTLERLQEAGGRILGIVLNRAQVEKHSYYYADYFGQYQGHHYAKYHERSGASKASPRQQDARMGKVASIHRNKAAR